MNHIELCQQIVERYRTYLETTFYFKDPQLRQSFQNALRSGHLSKGPYLEATPVFRRGRTAVEVFSDVLVDKPDEGFLKLDNRRLYSHQEEAILKAFSDRRNIVVATGTGSGKTESFLYPILLHLYQEFQKGKLGSGQILRHGLP